MRKNNLNPRYGFKKLHKKGKTWIALGAAFSALSLGAIYATQNFEFDSLGNQIVKADNVSVKAKTDIDGITTKNIAKNSTIEVMDGVESQDGRPVENLVDGDLNSLWVANGSKWPVTLHVQPNSSKAIKKLVLNLEKNHPDWSVDIGIKYAVNGVTSDLIDAGTIKNAKFGEKIPFDFKDGVNASDFYITLSNPKNKDEMGQFWPAIAELQMYVDRDASENIVDIAPEAEIIGNGDAAALTDGNPATLYMLAIGGMSTLPEKPSVTLNLAAPMEVYGFQTVFETLAQDTNNFKFTYKIEGKSVVDDQWKTLFNNEKATRIKPQSTVDSILAQPEEFSAVKLTMLNIESTGGDPWPALADFKVFANKDTQSVDEEDTESIAWKKPVHANNGQNLASRINNGSKKDSWYCSTYPSYVDIDLEDNYDISGMEIYTPKDGYEKYTIYTSVDGNNFTKYDAKTNKNPGTDEGDKYTKAATGRFVRVYMNYNSTNNGASLKEVRVFGKKAAKKSVLAKGPSLPDFKDTNYNRPVTNQDAVDSVRGIVSRRLGDKYNSWFDFEIKKSKSTEDFYDISNKNGKILIQGNDGVSLATGLNYYLKNVAKVNLSEVADQTKMPAQIKLVEKNIHRETKYPVRYAFNYTTMSYSMAYWGEDEWQKEIDWLALNGINLVLDTTGQEAVWFNFLKSAGFENQDIKDFISAPTYQAWQYMSNLSGVGGPLNDQFIEKRAELARSNQFKMRKLGMDVVLQAYSGMVPETISKVDPDVDLLIQNSWSGSQRPPMIKTDTPAFEKYADLFYKAQEKVLGKYAHHYAIDPFHEGGVTGGMDPSTISRIVLKNMMEFDPEAVWVIQSWQGNPTTALLRGLGDNRTDHALILDLHTENDPHWNEKNPGYYGGGEFMNTPWVLSIIENFGGRDGLSGHLDSILAGIKDATANGKYMQGIGMTPEANQTNPVIYEMLFETIWASDMNKLEEINLGTWIHDYAERRYGQPSENANKAWDILLETVYKAANNNIGQGAPESVINARPNLSINAASTWGNSVISYNKKDLEKALVLLMKDYDKLKSSPGYIYDLSAVMTQVLSNSAQEIQKDMASAYLKGDAVQFKKLSTKFLNIIDLVDQVTGTQTSSLLGHWTKPAERSVADLDDFSKDTALVNAKALVTTWGSINNTNAGGLKDYSNRQWSGLTKDFYKMRWEKWIAAYQDNLDNGTNNQISDAQWFETEWNWVNNGKNDYSEVADKTNLKNLYFNEFSDYLLSDNINLDSEKLADLLAEAQQKKESDYTSDSFAVLKGAIKSASDLLKTENPSKEDIKKATESLQAAIDGLVKKENNGGGNSGNNGGGNSGNNNSGNEQKPEKPEAKPEDDIQKLNTVGTIQYVPGYGVLLRDKNGKIPATKQYLQHGTSWKVNAKKVINGVTYYRLGNDNQWVEAKYINLKGENPIIKLNKVGKVVYHGKGGVLLLNKDGKIPAKRQYLKKNTSWKVNAKTTVNGRTLYRLGTNDQWIPAEYLKL